MKNEFTGTTKAWISGQYKSMADLNEMLKAGKNDQAADYISFCAHDMTASGWLEIGTATITVNLLGHENITNKQIAALEQQLQNERAESMQRQNYILERISKLQALNFDGAVVEGTAK